MRLLYTAYLISLNAWLNYVDPLGIVMNEVIRKDLVNPVLDDMIEKVNEK